MHIDHCSRPVGRLHPNRRVQGPRHAFRNDGGNQRRPGEKLFPNLGKRLFKDHGSRDRRTETANCIPALLAHLVHQLNTRCTMVLARPESGGKRSFATSSCMAALKKSLQKCVMQIQTGNPLPLFQAFFEPGLHLRGQLPQAKRVQ